MKEQMNNKMDLGQTEGDGIKSKENNYTIWIYDDLIFY